MYLRKSFITCSNCGMQFPMPSEVKVYEEIDVDIINSICIGSYFERECPGCHCRDWYDLPVYYINVPAKWSVRLIPGLIRCDEYECFSIPVEADDSWHLRVVHNLEELREKINCCVSGIDDLSLEILKSKYLDRCLPEVRQMAHKLYFVGIRDIHDDFCDDCEEDEFMLIFDILDEENELVITIEADGNIYSRYNHDLCVLQDYPVTGKWITVDSEAAGRIGGIIEAIL